MFKKDHLRKILLAAVFSLSFMPLFSQIVNCTLPAATIIVSTNTTIGFGPPYFRSILVCGGATLSYAESSSMDTIYLEPGAKVIFDSAFSYGYARIYAKNGSTIDMNWRQTGSLIYENGVTVIDSNTGPPSFFMGTQQITTLNYVYTALPGGVGCAPTALPEQDAGQLSMGTWNTENELYLASGNFVSPVDIIITSMSGQIVIEKKSVAFKEIINISSLPKGMYSLRWKSGMYSGKTSFLK